MSYQILENVNLWVCECIGSNHTLPGPLDLFLWHLIWHNFTFFRVRGIDIGHLRDSSQLLGKIGKEVCC